MRFESKRDAWLIAVMISPAVVLLIVRCPLVVKAIAVAVVVVLAVWTFRSTYYVVEAGTLTIRSMGLTWRVPIRDIHAITPTHSAASSPALSLDRLRIDYSGRAIMVSPQDKEHFIAALVAVNPAIMRRT